MFRAALASSPGPLRHAAVRSTPSSRGMAKHICVVGGGCAGQAVTHQLLNRGKGEIKVTMVEPADTHYYQPGWTLVGAGELPKASTARPMADIVDPRATWLKERVVALEPDANRVRTEGGKTVEYDFLVVAPGIQINWGSIAGLSEALADPESKVTSNYSFEYCGKTWDLVRSFEGGRALFTQPAAPVKCAGAPQKIMYLAEDRWRSSGVREKTRIDFFTGLPAIFGAPVFAKSLAKVCEERSLNTHFKHDLREVRGESNEAVFVNLDTGKEVVQKFDFLHAVPPMGAPDFVKESPLAAPATGFLSVNQETLQNDKYKNVFALGDASSLPTSKTAAAVSSQSRVLVQNLLDQMLGRALSLKYDGYTSCPLPTEIGKLILAEFDYTLAPTPTFPVDQTKPRPEMYYLKKYGMPALYWNSLIKGRWLGPKTLPSGFFKHQLGMY